MRRCAGWLVAGALWTGAAGGAAGAGPATAPGDTVAPVVVDSLVSEALARSPALAALQAREAAAVERVDPAGALPDPMVEVMLQDVGFPTLTLGRQEMSAASVEVQQGLLWPGRRRTRRAAAAAEAGLAGAGTASLRRTLIAEVRAGAADLYALDRERTLLGSARELLDLLAATVAARYAAGSGDQEAVVRQQLELSRLDERLADLAAERAGVVAGLNRLRDRPGGAPLGAVAALPEVPAPAPGWADSAVSRAPEVAVRRAALRVAEQRLAVARSDDRPGLTAGAGYGYRGGYDPVITLRLGVELPLWRGDKQAALRRAAAWEREAARRELDGARADADAEAAGLAARLRRDETQVTLYREAIVPRTGAAFDAARAAYLAGRGDFATVVEDFRMWLDARVELARREARRYATWARGEALRGGPDAGFLATGGGS
ncbi:MAG: TolC family protein [Candidatus Krumholzibacteriia bacterium]